MVHGGWPMYATFCLGFAFAAGHHAFYSHLDGKPADDQIQLLPRVLRVEDVDNEDDPEKNQRGFLEDFGLERLSGFGVFQSEFCSDVELNVLLMPDFVFQRQLGALLNGDMRIVPAGKADIYGNDRVSETAFAAEIWNTHLAEPATPAPNRRAPQKRKP